MHEHEELTTVAARLDLEPADIEAVTGELNIKIVGARGKRLLRFADVCKVIRYIDRPGETRWRSRPA